MHGARGAVKRLHWIWGVIVAALVVAGLSSPAAARTHHHLHVAAAADHKAWAPVDGHQLLPQAKHHRALHHAVRRYTPEPMLAARDAGTLGPSRLQPVALRADFARLDAAQPHLPPPTGPPLA